MWSYIWPVGLIVLSNLAYQICAKSVPSGIHPLASLTVTYLVGAAASALFYYLIAHEPGLMREYRALNWAPFAFGIVLVGLEVGFIYAYKAGWPVSITATVASAFLAVALIPAGYLLYHEQINLSKVAGVAVCLAGLWLLSRN